MKKFDDWPEICSRCKGRGYHVVKSQSAYRRRKKCRHDNLLLIASENELVKILSEPLRFDPSQEGLWSSKRSK